MKTPLRRFIGFPILALALGLPISSITAAPPTPAEVARRIHDRVRGVVSKVTDSVKGAVHRAEDDYWEEDAYYRRQYQPPYQEDEYYYERAPVPPPPAGYYRHSPAPPPPPGYYYEPYDVPPQHYYEEQTGISRGRDGTRYYTPDYVEPYIEPESEVVRPSVPQDSPPVIMKQKKPGNQPSPAENNPVPNRNFQNTPEPAPLPNSNSNSQFSPRENTPDRSATNNKETNQQQKPASTGELKYATAVPGKPGFVYPPGVKQETANMLDVRGLNAGQKARDPRTGETFLVPY